MIIKQDLIAFGRGNRPNIKMIPQFITIHNTGNVSVGANALMHSQYIKGDAAANRPASWHFTVDDKDVIYQHLPLNEVGWHAGDGRGTGNMKSIGIEMCVNSDGDWEKTIDNTIWLCKKLIEENNITDIKQHFDWSGKNCPSKIRGQGRWNELITRIKGVEIMKIEDKVKIKSTATNYATGEPIDSLYKNKEYTIREMGAGKALIRELTSWVYLKDLELANPPVVVATVPKSDYDRVVAQLKTSNSKYVDFQGRIDVYKVAYDTVVADLRSQVENLKKQVDELTHQLTVSNGTILTQTNRINSLNATYQSTRTQLDSVAQNLASEKILLKSKLEENASLSSQIEKCNTQTDTLELTISELDDQIDELVIQMVDKDEDIVELTLTHKQELKDCKQAIYENDFTISELLSMLFDRFSKALKK